LQSRMFHLAVGGLLFYARGVFAANLIAVGEALNEVGRAAPSAPRGVAY
jgi:hypothetical protein